MRYGIVEGMPRVKQENFHEMLDKGWFWLKNIPRFQENPFVFYSHEEIMENPCLGVIEETKAEFGEFNVTCGVPLDEEGKMFFRSHLLGLYIIPDVSQIDFMIQEWEQIPSIRSKILDARLDRWLEINGR